MTRTLSALFAVVLLFDWSKTAADAHGHRAEGQASVGISYTQTGDLPQLELNRPILRPLAVGEKQSYVMVLDKGKYLRVSVLPLGIKVVVILLDPDGRLLQQEAASDELTIRCITSAAGKYRLVVRGFGKSGPSGRYEMKIDALRTATEHDITIVSARELERALDRHEPGVKTYFYSRRKDEPEISRITVRLFGAAGNYGQILELDLNALSTKDQPDQTVIAQALLNLGNDHRSFGDHREALEAFRRAFAWSEAAGDIRGMVYALSGMGIVYQRQNNPALALDRLHRSLALAASLTEGVPPGFVAVVFLNLGAVYALQKDFGQALESFQSSLSSLRDFGYVPGPKPPEMVAVLFNNIGFAYSDLGDYDQALLFLEKALIARDETDDKEGIIQALNNIGSVYARQKDYGKALEYFRRSLATVRDKQAKADTLK